MVIEFFYGLSLFCKQKILIRLLQFSRVESRTELIILKMETADYEHIGKMKETVYEPSEDTFLLIDALENDREKLIKSCPRVVLEIGCGSGVVISTLAKYLGNNALYLCTDINEDAVMATTETADRNGVSIEVIQTDLIDGLLPRLRGMVDIILFNPPYVPTPEHEIRATKLSASWAGGINGRKVMDRIFPFIGELLSSIGVFYLIVVPENQIDEIRDIFLKAKFASEVVICRPGGEKLKVLKFWRQSTTKC